MESTTSTKPHALVWIAGVAVTAFSAVGIAAIMGWIPTSMGKRDDTTVVAKIEAPKQALAKPAAARQAERPAAAKVNAPAAATPSQQVVASSAPVAKAICVECGVIESVRSVDTKGDGTGLGAVGGAVVGGVVGNQIGRGSGNTVATVAGAVGGAVAGHHIEKYVKTTKSYEIMVRLENGSSRMFHETAEPTWKPGDRVKVVNGVLQFNS